MSGGILRFPWTSQPQVPVGIDWGNPLTRGLKALLVPTALGNKLLNIVPGGTEVTTSGTISRSIGPSGVGQKYGDASGAAAQTYTFPSGYLQTAGSVFWKGQRHASGPAIFRDNQINTTGTLVWDNGASAWNARVNGTTLSGVGSFPVDKDVNFLLTGNASGSQFYVNGASLGSVGAAWNWNGSTHFKLHVNTGNAQGVLATDYLVAIYDRNLSAAEAKNLSNNPWQLFAPIQRTIWVPNAGGGGPTYTLTADSASYTLTGQDATLAFNRAMVAASAAYTLTGQDAGLAFNRVLSAANGSYALDGQDVTLTYTPISGATYTLGAASGSFALTGQDTGIAFNRVLTADTQSYSLSGQTAGLAFNRVLTANTVSYALTGQDAAMTYTGYTYTLNAESGTFFVDGQDANLVYSGGSSADTGDGSMSRKRYYLRRKGKILLFDTVAQADDYLEAEEEAQKAIAAAKSRGAKKRIAAKILKAVEPVESVEIAPLQELVKAYSMPVNLPKLLTQQDYQQVMDVRAMIQRIQDDEDDELLLLLA